MFSFQIAGNHFKYRLFFNLFLFNNNAMICSNGQLPVLLVQYYHSKCSFPMQMYKKVAAIQEQQFRMFRHSCLLQNSPNTSSSMSALDVDEATATNEEFYEKEVEAKQQQQLKETEKQTDLTEPIQKENVQKVFAKRIYWSQTDHEILNIFYKMGKSGQKFLELEKGFGPKRSKFKHILVPQDVFGFVRAMDEVLKAVHANKKSIIEALSKRQERLVLHTAKATGTNYGFKLELFVFKSIIFVQMCVPNENGQQLKPVHLFLTLHQFHWLRHTIGELFAENGEENVQQQLGKPPGYPSWLNPKNQSHNSMPNNRRNFQSPQPQNVQFTLRQLPQRVAPVQQQIQQPAQPKMPPSSAPMSEQLLQLVFLQQQQLQQIKSSILKDQPMGGVGGASAQKMGPDNTILMSDLLAQAPTQQSAMPKWSTNNNIGYRKNLSGNRYSNNQGYRTDDEHCD